ncbi:unnamed protein product [Dovyalis caffra]|uniref:Cytochrome P450 704C1 n=1 Tax=Dovyalis caffra TaxID=77055 RepID=A0AAV1SCE7_9ROSI|nr:unnamed protein product [Dovyalis caffra]
MDIISAIYTFTAAALLFISSTFLYLALKIFTGKSIGNPNYPPVKGTIFNQLLYFNRLYDYQTEVAKKQKTYRLLTPEGSVVYTTDTRNIEHMLKANFEKYNKGKHNQDIFTDFFGEGIFAVDGVKWRQQRKLASTEFSTRVLRDFSCSVFRRNATKLVRVVSKLATAHQVFDMQDTLMRFTLDSIFKVGFGVHLNCLEGSSKEGTAFMMAFDDSNALIYWRYMDPFWKLKRFFNIGCEALLRKNIKIMDDFVNKLIRNKRKLMAERQLWNDKEDILSRFLVESEKDPIKMNDRHLRDIILNFMIAGKDSTANTLSWFFYMLCKDPLIQEKVAQEVRDITGSHDDKVNVEDFMANITDTKLEQMHYLHSALTETLRLYPAAPVDGRCAEDDDILPDGFRLKKGDGVYYLAYAMGRMPYIWGEDAEDFRPERWLNNGIFQPESPFKFIAFHAGPRICLGKDFAYRQMKIVSIALLRFFRFKLADDTREVTYRTMLTLHIDGGLHLQAVPRTNSTANALSWLFYMLCKNPLIQEEVAQGLIDFWTLEQMHYLHAALTGTLRLYPAVGPRTCLREDFAYQQMKIVSIALLSFFQFKLADDTRENVPWTSIWKGLSARREGRRSVCPESKPWKCHTATERCDPGDLRIGFLEAFCFGPSHSSLSWLAYRPLSHMASMDSLSNPLIFSALVLIISILIVQILARKLNKKKKKPKYHPVGGTVFNQLLNFNRLHHYMTDLAGKYKTYRLLAPFRSEIYTADPVNVEYILKSNFGNYGKGDHNYNNLSGLLGDGIFTVDGDQWLQQRKVSSYEFSTKVLRDFSSVVFRKNAAKLANIVSEAAKANQSMDIQDLFMKSTLDSIFKVAFGVELDSMCGSNEEGVEFSNAFDDASALTLWRYVDVFWKIKSKIEQMRNSEDVSSLKKDDILSRFLQLSENDPTYLRDIILNFVIAGKDTTAAALSWFIYMLCKHPAVQEKVAQEVRETTKMKEITNFAEFTASIDEEALGKMNYLHAAITETLRLYPSVPVDAKVCFSDDTLPDGFNVRKGDMVAYQPYAMGRMKFIWGDDAEEYKPERWLNEDGMFQQESPFKFTAFQAGPRICLGKEFAYRQMKIFAAVLLGGFIFKLADEKKPVNYRTMINLHVDGGLHVCALHRSRT